MPIFSDQTARKVLLENTPKRIVSTVPSQTELLYYLGLNHNVVGITGFCAHPKAWKASKTIIGGTKDLQIAKIKGLKPDLIIGNKEENLKSQIEELAQNTPVWLSDIKTFNHALDMISSIGELLDKKEKANNLIQSITVKRNKFSSAQKVKALYFIWNEPFMVAGHNTFISSMLSECGFENCAPKTLERYPSLNLEQIAQCKAQVLLLASEPFSFTTKDAHFISQETGKNTMIVDGEYFSWYGSRMLKAFDYFQRLKNELNPYLSV